ncbi:MAG: methyltransferase domain-containing protein [Planctomycetota bacterium]
MPQETDHARRFYDRISSVYDALSDSSEAESRQTGLKMLELSGGESCLEIGYGTGHCLLELAQAVGPEGKVVGIDISSGMRDVAAKRLNDAWVGDRVRLEVGTVPPIQEADQSFDVVFLTFTLELFPEDQIPSVLSEVARVLRPGGRLGVVCMAAPRKGERSSLLERTYVWMHQHFPHIVDCAPIDPDSLIGDAGLTVQQSHREEIWTMPVAMVLATK